MSGALGDALASVRAGRGRSALRALGIALAAAMLAVSATVAYGLHSGFSRSANAADLPDVIARFDAVSPSLIAARIRALPDVASFSLRKEITGVELAAGSHAAGNGVVEVVAGGPRGYAIVAGHDLSGAREGVVLETGVARSWGLVPGEEIAVAGLGQERILGLSRSPENVAFPLATPRVYISEAALQARFGGRAELDRNVNLAEIWLRNPAGLDAMLVQARTTSYGLHDLSILTRSGVRVLIDEAAGIVIALLAALSLVALLTAAVMLAAAARAEVQRRLRAIGVRLALGASRAYVAAVCTCEALIVAVPAAAVGVGAGALVGAGPSDRLLALLNEAPPGAALAPALLACFALTVVIPTLLAAWPAWRAAGGAPVRLLRGAELRGRSRRRARPAAVRAGSFLRLGVRLAGARRVRLAATVCALAACSAFVLLMLALAAELGTLENDPAALGRRYQLTASLPAHAAARVRTLPGVEAAAPKYEVDALDSFSLGEVIDVIAYPHGVQGSFEDPPLVQGRADSGPDQAEVGLGLAQVLGLSPGATLALALPTGRELRLRVSGVVSSLQHDGRVAYVPAAALLAADPGAGEQLAVRLRPGASAAGVSRTLHARGASVSATGGVSSGGGALVAALRALLQAVAAVDALVVLYTLAQALALTAAERRAAIAQLRACGAGARSVRALLAGAALAVLAPAVVIGVALERLLLGPAIAHIAAGYAVLALGAGAKDLAILLAGLIALAGAAVTWVAARALAEPVARGLA